MRYSPHHKKGLTRVVGGVCGPTGRCGPPPGEDQFRAWPEFGRGHRRQRVAGSRRCPVRVAPCVHRASRVEVVGSPAALRSPGLPLRSRLLCRPPTVPSAS